MRSAETKFRTRYRSQRYPATAPQSASSTICSAPPSAPESVQTRPHAMPNTHPASLPTCIETHATSTGTKQSFTPKNRGLPKLTVCNTRTSSTSAAYKPHIRAFLYRSRMVSRLSVCRFSAY